MSLDDLPDIQFCDTDPTTAQTEAVSAYEAITGLSLAAGVSPARLAALRAEIAEAVAGQDNESILLTL